MLFNGIAFVTWLNQREIGDCMSLTQAMMAHYYRKQEEQKKLQDRAECSKKVESTKYKEMNCLLLPKWRAKKKNLVKKRAISTTYCLQD